MSGAFQIEHDFCYRLIMYVYIYKILYNYICFQVVMSEEGADDQAITAMSLLGTVETLMSGALFAICM